MPSRRYKPVYTRMLRGDVDQMASVAAAAGAAKSRWMRDVVVKALDANKELDDWGEWAPSRGRKGDTDEDRVVVVAVSLLRDDFDRLKVVAARLADVTWGVHGLRRGVTKSTWIRRVLVTAIGKDIDPTSVCVCGHHAGQHDVEGCLICRCWRYRLS